MAWSTLQKRKPQMPSSESPYPLVPAPDPGHEGVGNVGRVVDAEADGNDEVGAGHRVDRQAPEVDEAAHVDQGEDDAEQHLDSASWQVSFHWKNPPRNIT